jgi:signal transduction histidine kinase
MVSITDPFKAIASWFTPRSKGKEVIQILEQIAKGNFKHVIKISRKEKDEEHRQILRGLKLTLKELHIMDEREKRRRRQVLKANKQLRELDKNKTEFMELASHQLKTPLASMQLGLDLLKRNAETWEKDERIILDQISGSYEHLSKLVQSVIAAMKVDEKVAMQPKLQQANVSQILKALDRQFSNRFKAKNINFEINKPANSVRFKTDPEFLIEILHNLLENSLKYTKGGKVSFDVDQKNGKVEFIVTDTGIGVPFEEQKRAFDKLFRASNVKNLADQGTGLGLYYTKQLVKFGLNQN